MSQNCSKATVFWRQILPNSAGQFVTFHGIPQQFYRQTPGADNNMLHVIMLQ